jgi:hypothetical protein
VPLESLPYVDEHVADVAATAERTWEALVAYIGTTGRNRRGRMVANRLGCVPSEPSGEPGEIGSTIPGFIVTRSIPPAVMALMGEHRFSRYALIFRITETPSGTVRLGAETRAEFPGGRGRLYRTLVIGSRGHVLATRSILRAVRKLAER